MQRSFSDLEYAANKITRLDRFLGEIDVVTPWSVLVAEVEPFYPKGDTPRRGLMARCSIAPSQRLKNFRCMFAFNKTLIYSACP